MFSRYHIRWGIVFSLTIAVLASIPALFRQDIRTFGFNVVMMTVTILLCWLIHHFFLLGDFSAGRHRPDGWRILLSICVGTVVVALLFGLRLVVVRVVPVFGVNLFRAAVVSAFSWFVVYSLQANLQLQRSRLENEYLKQDQLKAQLFSLQQQLSPHFLFNSLSTLKTIAPDAGTKTYVMQLANVYRYLLSFHDTQQITLRDELAFTRSYLYILQERYEDALQVTIEIGDGFLGFFLPPVTLQILIENALKHNIVSMEQPLRLRIFAEEDGGGSKLDGSGGKTGAVLTIENSYQPRLSVEESVGTGLQNINDRYRLLSGQGIAVRLDGAHFIVNLPLLRS